MYVWGCEGEEGARGESVVVSDSTSASASESPSASESEWWWSGSWAVGDNRAGERHAQEWELHRVHLKR